MSFPILTEDLPEPGLMTYVDISKRDAIMAQPENGVDREAYVLSTTKFDRVVVAYLISAS